ncbi:hypothetical protein BC829DRAFT_387511 [Chytridium lagenaria]|nr:hypothetical protein BC829DRAFT_387511 [Chytridium lagenaria]
MISPKFAFPDDKGWKMVDNGSQAEKLQRSHMKSLKLVECTKAIKFNLCSSLGRLQYNLGFCDVRIVKFKKFDPILSSNQRHQGHNPAFIKAHANRKSFR